MNIRLLAGLALAFTVSPAGAEGWLLVIDVPGTAGGQFVAPGQVVRIDDGESLPVAIDAGLPTGAEAGALAEHPDGGLCWSVIAPVDLPDGQFAAPDEVYCHHEGTYTRRFRGGDFGLEPSAAITSMGWNAAGELHLSFAVPLAVSGSLVAPGTRVRVDGTSLTPVPDAPTLPPRAHRLAATFNDDDQPVLALSTPAAFGGAFGGGLVVLINDSGSVSPDDSLAALFDDSRRIGLSGLHRLLPEAAEDFLFSDRFEAH